MTFEEWFEKDLEGLPHIAEGMLRNLRFEFERVWNSAMEEAAQELEGRKGDSEFKMIVADEIRSKKTHKNNNN